MLRDIRMLLASCHMVHTQLRFRKIKPCLHTAYKMHHWHFLEFPEHFWQEDPGWAVQAATMTLIMALPALATWNAC